MTRLDDFLEPLQNGVWEVIIDKKSVSEPLDSGWEKSQINIPTPGTIDSYRKGQCHVHETKSEWKVHLDRYDPKIHPILHLIDDAPFLLMISDTFRTMFAEARGKKSDVILTLLEQKNTWKQELLFGFILILLGISFILEPEFLYNSIVQLFIPLGIVILGVVTILDAIRKRKEESEFRAGIYHGIKTILLGLILSLFPVDLWDLIILMIIGLWMFSSAFMLLKRVLKGKKAVPEGFWSRCIIGIISLVIAVLIFFTPYKILGLFIIIGGLISTISGITLIIIALRLRMRMETKTLPIS